MQKKGHAFREALLLLKHEDISAPWGFIATPTKFGRVRIYKDYDDFMWIDVGKVSIQIAHMDDIRGASQVEAHMEKLITLLRWGLEEAVFKLNSEGL